MLCIMSVGLYIVCLLYVYNVVGLQYNTSTKQVVVHVHSPTIRCATQTYSSVVLHFTASTDTVYILS